MNPKLRVIAAAAAIAVVGLVSGCASTTGTDTNLNRTGFVGGLVV